MSEYLYGSSIQGIQSYIFSTNKLVEIVGASEIVDQLSNKLFLEEFQLEHDENNFLIKAAGNIKWFTANEKLLDEIVLRWPKFVEEKAPGLTVSQAIVKVEDNIVDAINELEEKLKAARNKIGGSSDLSPMAALRSRRTGRPAVNWGDEGKPKDNATTIKCNIGKDPARHHLMEKCFKDTEKRKAEYYPYNIDDIKNGSDKRWLAVVHADGNSLGKLIQQMAKHLRMHPELAMEAFRRFSDTLDTSTKIAAQKAIEKIVQPVFNKLIDDSEAKKKYPFRPVVLGGDDLTIIIRADLALEFTECFLVEFQKNTKENFKGIVNEYKLKDFSEGLTACAGIAYMKETFPFYYSVHLAENLCSDAKKNSKEISAEFVPASISFHKIQDSFVESYSEIQDRELSVIAENGNGDRLLKKGPYYIDNISGKPSVSELTSMRDTLLKKDAPQSGIRKWLTILHQDRNKADFWMERVMEISPKYCSRLKMTNNGWKENTHLYDVMSLASFYKGGDE